MSKYRILMIMPDCVVRVVILALLVVAQISLPGQDVHKPGSTRDLGKAFWSLGLPYLTAYTARDYKVSGQNWAILQSHDGFMYAGNTNGVLEFDGLKWRLIKTPGNSPVKSLAIDSHGRIFCGGVNEIGYLEPHQTEGMVYHSLLSELDTGSRAFGDVWVTHALRDTLYFVSDSYLMRWDGKHFRVWKEKNIGFSWIGRGQLWIQLEGRGLHKMTHQGLVPVTEFDAGFPDQSVTTGLALGSKEWMLITSDNKGYRITETGEKKVADYFGLQEGFVYRATRLRDGNYVLACIDGGLYITTSDGHTIKHLTRRDGLTSNTILDAFVDAAGDLWLAADKGIMRLEWDSPLRRFDTFLGIDEEVNDVAIFRNRVYAATTSGLRVIDPEVRDDRPAFVKVPRMEYLTSDLEVVGDHLFVGNYFGMFSMDSHGQIERLFDKNVHAIGAPVVNGDYLLFSTSTSIIGELIKDKRGWRRGPATLAVAGRPYNMVRASNGNVFIGTRYNGIYELAYQTPSTTPAIRSTGRRLTDPHQLVHFDTTRGLPSEVNHPLVLMNDELFVPSRDGLYRLDDRQDTLRRFESVMQHFQGHPRAGVHMIGEAGDSSYWVTVNEAQTSSLYKFDHGLLNRISAGDRFLQQGLESIFSLDGISLFATSEGLVAYNGQQSLVDTTAFATKIRSVSVDGDSVVFAGHDTGTPELRLGYALNSPVIEFALPDYEIAGANAYQYKLEGFNEDWSKWSPDTRVTFTHLPEGHYTFRVRGRNGYGKVARDDAWSFTILPPPYRSWWAYSAYVLLFIGFLRLVSHWRSRKYLVEKATLEHMVLERTKEVNVQTEKLKEMDRAKARFYANISHEFRTPLTLILAPLDEQIARTPDAGKWKMMRRNAQRLLELVNQMLDLSKLDAGKMELRARPGDPARLLELLAASFDSLAEYRDIRFIKRISKGPHVAWFDSDKLEKIATNLLANAFKFTPAGGVVFLEAVLEQENNEAVFIITLSDNGRGISPEEQEQIFSPFYQSRNANDGQEQGTGLGLSLVKELVVLHHGTISVKSAEAGGSTFCVRLPVNREVFASKERDEQRSSGETIYEGHSPNLAEASGLTPRIPETQDSPERISAPTDNVAIERDTVIVVEDNSDLRQFISSILEQDYNVITARDGEEGIAMATQSLPDLILTDLMMPRLDGMQLTERVKGDERTSHIPVVLLTARNESADRLNGFRIGADDYLTKPFSAEELLVRVASLITQRRKLAEVFRDRVLVGPTPQQHISLDDKFLFKLRDAVEARLSEPGFGVEQLAGEACMSRTQLFRKLNALARISPSDFIRDIRLKRAAELIAAKADTVSQIGYSVGFRDQSYFAKCFKKQFGMAPSEYGRANGSSLPHPG